MTPGRLAVTIDDPRRVRDPAAPAVVLLHGVFMDQSLWDRVAPHLRGLRVVRLDMPSHGSSPDLERGASIDDHVLAVAATLEALDVPTPILVGHSWGGMVATRLARSRPDLVAGLVLVNTPLLRVRGRSRLGFQLQRFLLAAGLSPAVYGRLAASALIGADHRRTHPDDVHALAARARRMGRRRLRETLRSVLLEPEDELPLLLELDLAWTMLAGEDDYVISGGVRETVAATGRLALVPGGHTSPLEQPEAVARAIIAGVAGPWAGGPARPGKDRCS